MNPERYRAAGEIFHAVLSVPAEERPAFLREACGHDDELRSEVESLLTAHAAVGTFVERPAMEVAAALIAEAARVEPHERIGRFEVMSRIGRGGMGDVYRVRDHALGRDVALKLPRHAATADALRRFESEARAASSLNHPNIVTIHEIGEADGRRFIAMELVEGQPLAALIGPPMELGRLVRLGRQVAQALAVAHAAGIVHGDIKPENLMLRSDGYVKVLDFGIARLASGRMESGNGQATTTVTFGTPRYMSPEQLHGAVATDASDIFACGVVLYELATGRHPFGAESVPVLDRALDTQSPPLSRDGAHLPPPLERFVMRMLATAPRERPKAAEIEAAFGAIEMAPDAQRHAARPPHNLPAQRTAFVGREAELRALEEILTAGAVRLVTMTGTGGTGKTRLAFEVAARVADRFPGGVSLTNLASTADPRLVLPVIARTHGISDAGDRPVRDALREHLQSRGRMLLLLDNFEHLTQSAELIRDLLDSCPALTVLVTSRIVLRLYGEQEFPVPPLPVPGPGAATPGSLIACPSVELLVMRATSVRPDLRLTAMNAQAVAEICRRLDGLPLAIELAATRIKVLPPTEVLARLDRRFDLLTRGPKDSLPRQQTLRDALDWSYDLLDPAERTLFRRMAVFAGSSALDAVEAVCNAEEDLAIDVLGGVTALVDNSLLLQRQSDDGPPMFAMLETVREYARERLDESGETAAVRHAHAAYALVLAEECRPETPAAEREMWLHTCEMEHDDMRAAMAHLVAAGHAEWGLRLATALFKFWEWREHLTEGRESLSGVLALPGAQAATRARALALYYHAVLADAQRDHEAAADSARKALAIYQQLGDTNGMATTTNGLACEIAKLDGHSAEASELFAQAAALWDSLDDGVAADQARSNMAAMARAGGDHARARTLLEQVVATSEKRGDVRSLAATLNALGTLAADVGDLVEARRRHHESVTRFRQSGDRAGVARVLADLASLDMASGDVPAATRYLVEACRTFHEAANQRGVASQLEMLAWCASHESRHAVAVALAGAAAAIRGRIRVSSGPVERDHRDRAIAAARRALGDDEYARAWEDGQQMTVDAALAGLQPRGNEAPSTVVTGIWRD